MANEHSGVKFFVIFAIIIGLTYCPNGCAKEEDGENPMLEMVQTLLQESIRNHKGGSGLNLLGDMVQGFLQSEGGKQVGDMLVGNQKVNGGAAQLLSNLASMWQTAKTVDNVNAKRSKTEEFSVDPSILGTMIDLVGTLSKAATSDGDSHNVERRAGKNLRDNKKDEGAVDWDSVLNVAGNLISTMSGSQEKSHSSAGSNAGFESLLSFLPVLLSSISGQHNIHASKSIPHHSHEQFLPPFLENLHEYWDHFSSSEFGKTLWENSGLANLVKFFTDSQGQFEVEKIFGSLENNSFRRMWVKSIANFIAQWIKHFTDPQVQYRYLDTVQLICNSFLKAQGYPKETLMDLNHPAESISVLANAVFKKQFNLKVNSEVYVRPAIAYIQELFRLGQKKGFGVSKLSTKDIETKLSETLDAEIIEPILRVNRAYKFSKNRKECTKYVICAINQPEEISKSGLKPGITKLASMAASWFLSGNLNTEFWELFDVAVEESGCAKYDNMCSEFHSEDLKATTEYFHNEL